MDGATEVRLVWQQGERFTGTVGGVPVALDGSSGDELSPMRAVALGLAGCMAIDVATILEKGRQPLAGLEVVLETERAEKPPRRFLAFRLRFRVAGAVEPDRVERAVELSRSTYCSVWHSLRDDIELDVAWEIVAPG